MTTAKALSVALRLLVRAYPDHVRRHLSEQGAMNELRRLYEKFLEDIADELLLSAVEAHIASSKWWPKVAELRSQCADLAAQSQGLPSAFEAWAEVKVATRNHSCEFSTPLIRKAMDGVGGLQAFRLSDTDHESAWRARFYQSYETLVKRERDDAILPEMTRKRLEGLFKRLEDGNGHENGGDTSGMVPQLSSENHSPS